MAASTDLLDMFFSANASAMKVLKVATGSWNRAYNDTVDYVQTIPHGYNNDDIFVMGWVVDTNNLFPEDIFIFGLPYVDADGFNIVTATWDNANVYIENPWDGSTRTTGLIDTYTYTVLICIV